MAISTVDYHIFSMLRELDVFPPRPNILELGESNWYGDMPMEALSDCIENFVRDAQLRERLHQRMVDVLCAESPYKAWDLAKIFYKVFMDYATIAAIDLHGTPSALKIDLNHPVELGEQFDVLVNIGTAEHVFNVFEFFRTSHKLTRPGGIMVHMTPFRGWLEHGFYSFNPTFFWDLAFVNDYALLLLVYTEPNPPKLVPLTRREQITEMAREGGLGKEANLYAVLKKPASEAEFRAPMQGVYAGTVSTETTKAWIEDR